MGSAGAGMGARCSLRAPPSTRPPFIAESAGRTRVELEHRHFERHGAGAEALPAAVGSENGWPAILHSYGEAAASADQL